MYQPVLPHTDPVPPNTSQYRPILTQYHHISMSLNVPCNSVPRKSSLGTMSRQLFQATIVPLNNCSSQQFCLRSFTNGHSKRGRSSEWPKSRGRWTTDCCKLSSGWSGLLLLLCKWSFAKRTVLQMAKIKGMEEAGLSQMTIWMIRPPRCSSVLLQMVICKEDGPTNDQHLFGQMGLKFAPAPSMEDPQYRISAQTVQELEQSDWWTLTSKCVGNYALPVRWKVSRVIEYLPQLSQSLLSLTD